MPKKQLPDEFWTQPAEAMQHEPLRALYYDVVEEMKAELAEKPGFATLETMMVERVVYLYFRIRDKEAQGAEGFDHDRNYKEINQLWSTMAANLQKNWLLAQDPEKVRQHVYDQVSETVEVALLDFPSDVAQAVQDALVKVFQEQGT